jgi:hypothetical protein
MQDLMNELSEARKLLNECLVFYKNTGRQLADAELKYRVALRKEFLRLKLEDGVAWTACGELARGEETVAQLRFTRDLRKSDYLCTYEKILQLKTELRIIEGEIEAERKGI